MGGNQDRNSGPLGPGDRNQDGSSSSKLLQASSAIAGPLKKVDQLCKGPGRVVQHLDPTSPHTVNLDRVRSFLLRGGSRSLAAAPGRRKPRRRTSIPRYRPIKSAHLAGQLTLTAQAKGNCHDENDVKRLLFSYIGSQFPKLNLENPSRLIGTPFTRRPPADLHNHVSK